MRTWLFGLLGATALACGAGAGEAGPAVDAGGLDVGPAPDGGVAVADAGTPDVAPDGGVAVADAGDSGARALDAGDGGTEAPAVPFAVAFGDCDGAFRVPDRYPNQLLPGTDLEKLTLGDADAVCNDGTPAVLFVRAATDPAHADDWMLHLQGGGGCGGYEECRVRWCGDDYYDASKMSSAYTPAAIRGVGVHDPGEANAFAGWNHAYFYYCSSDSWTGQGLAILRAEQSEGGEFPTPRSPRSRRIVADPADPSRRVSMERRGHTILERALARLAGGAASDDGSERLPGLAAARTVVFSGTSAGSVGAQQNLDWVAEAFDPTVTRIVGLFDAAISPGEGTISPAFEADRSERAKVSYAARAAAEGIAPFVDESCAAALGAEAWRCQASLGLHFDHVSTPFFVRMDLSDSLAVGNYRELGVPPAVYRSAMHQTLAALADRPGGPGIYGPNCGQHVGIETSTWFLETTVADPESGAEVTLHDAFRAWLGGRDVKLIDEVARARSRCAP